MWLGGQKYNFGKFERCLKYKKIFQIPKSKNEEISLPFSGQGTKMATWNLGQKMPNLVKIAFFSKITSSRSICKWCVARNLFEESFDIFLKVLKFLNAKIQNMRKFHYQFLGRVLKWPTWNLGQKCQIWRKSLIFENYAK